MYTRIEYVIFLKSASIFCQNAFVFWKCFKTEFCNALVVEIHRLNCDPFAGNFSLPQHRGLYNIPTSQFSSAFFSEFEVKKYFRDTLLCLNSKLMLVPNRSCKGEHPKKGCIGVACCGLLPRITDYC